MVQVTSPEDARVRVDACVNRANTLSAWAGAEAARGRADKGAELLAAAVEGYRGPLEQEEDAAVGPSQAAHHCCELMRRVRMLRRTLSHGRAITEAPQKQCLGHGCHMLSLACRERSLVFGSM